MNGLKDKVVNSSSREASGEHPGIETVLCPALTAAAHTQASAPASLTLTFQTVCFDAFVTANESLYKMIEGDKSV